MGLSSGENGVKSLFRERYGRAFKQLDTLGDLRKALKVERSDVTAVHDGNVAMMTIPKAVVTLDAYVGIFTSMIKKALGSAAVVVVVFDEPEILTHAKREEQAKRDASRTKKLVVCSSDLKTTPTDDKYGVAQLDAAVDVHDVIGSRPARQRAFDEIGLRTLANIRKVIQTWEADGHGRSVLLFDGLDPRGASRPVDEPRAPALFGTCDELAALLAHAPAGEGDLKLALVQQKVREIALLPEAERPVAMKNTKLHLSVTIDTDSICIELLEQARRAVENPELNTAVKGVLAFREPAAKRKHPLDRTVADGDEPNASFSCCDYTALFKLIVKDLWGDVHATPLQQRSSVVLMSAGLALCGSDFTMVKGLRADIVMDVLKSMINQSPALVLLMQAAWEGGRQDVAAMVPALRRLVLLCEGDYKERPRARKACVEAMQEVVYNDPAPLLRAAWLCSYWCGAEITGDLHEFGFARAIGV